MNLYRSIEQNRTYIIAEMSANHAGSYERAKEIIHAAKESGADCIKLQTYTADTMTIDCDNQYFRIDNGTWQGENLYHLYKKAYTPWEWQADLKREAENVGIDFLSTPFDVTSVDFLEELGVDFYKIASFELVDLPLLEYVALTGKPVILSTGMGSLGEVEEAINAIKKQGNDKICLLKCSSAYPAISDDMNLETIADMEKRFCVPIGLSDHSLGNIAAVIAVAMGAKIVEKHFCLSREIETPDSSFSMEPQEFKQMVENIRMAEKAKGKVQYGVSQQDKNNINFRRSIFAIKDIKKGETLSGENIRIIRPGHGLRPKYINEVLGKSALVNIPRGTPIDFGLIEK